MEFTYRGVPEKFIKEGVFGYHKTPILIGDTVEAVRNIQQGRIPINTRVKVINILVEPSGYGRGFTKRIMVE
mgnify:CR=1 FL=1